MHAQPLKVGRGKRAEDAGHGLAAGFDEVELLGKVPLVIGEFGGEGGFIAAEESRLVLGENRFHPVEIHRLKIGEVADDFQRAPLAGNGAGRTCSVVSPATSLRRSAGPAEYSSMRVETDMFENLCFLGNLDPHIFKQHLHVVPDQLLGVGGA